MARKETVTKVLDGDTFKTSSRRRPVRLARVNAPERGQPGAAQATRDLRKLIDGKEVRIETVGRSFGRAVANVYKGQKSVNRAMRKKG